MKKIRPLGKRVLVKRATAHQTKGGILLPESAQEKPREGEVIAVGEGAMNAEGIMEKPALQTGDRVLFSAYAGTEVKQTEEDVDLIVMSEDDILAVLS